MGLVIEAGQYKNLTATGDVSTKNVALVGFYVNSTSGGTLVLKEGGTGGTALGGTITPDIGFHAYPVRAESGLHATIAGTINVTFFYLQV